MNGDDWINKRCFSLIQFITSYGLREIGKVSNFSPPPVPSPVEHENVNEHESTFTKRRVEWKYMHKLRKRGKGIPLTSTHWTRPRVAKALSDASQSEVQAGETISESEKTLRSSKLREGSNCATFGSCVRYQRGFFAVFCEGVRLAGVRVERHVRLPVIQAFEELRK